MPTQETPLTTFPSITSGGLGSGALLAMELPPVEMVVGSLIPAGLFLLAADPKTGKTMLAQDLALSIALGHPAWGGLASVQQGDVMFIANEGGPVAFRQRLQKMLQPLEDASPSFNPEDLERFRVAECHEKLGGPLESNIEWWLKSVANPRLVVIDTLASVAPSVSGGNRHQDDHNMLAGLAHLSKEFPKVLMLLVHHTNKSDGVGDVMHRISGSHGLTGATDGMAVLTQVGPASPQCRLNIRPRNAEESDVILQRGSNLRFGPVEAGERTQLSEGRQQILDWLDRHPEGGGPKAIAAEIGIPHDSVRQYLAQMKDKGQVLSPSRGIYVSVQETERAA